MTRTITFLLTIALAASAAAQDDPRLVEARERQARGRALLDAGDANGALVEFERVYALLEGHPRRYMALSNIGRCHQSLGQYDRALDYYRRYLEEGGPDAEDREAVQAASEALLGLLGTLELTTNVETAEVWIDNRRAGSAPGTLRVPVGRHAVELRAEGHSPARREIELAARQELTLRIELEALGGPSGIDPAFFWSGLALTLLTAGASGGVGAAFLVAHGDNEGRVADGTLAAGDVAEERDLALVADVLLATAGALAIGTAVLGFVTRWDTERDSPRVAVDLAPDRVAIVVAGSFR